jgi:arylformamidase
MYSRRGDGGSERRDENIRFDAGIVIVEGLDLGYLRPCGYDLYCLQLKLVGSDGAPARAILVGE